MKLPPEIRNLMTGQRLIENALGLSLLVKRMPKPLPPHAANEDCHCLDCELSNAVREGREAINSDSTQVKQDALFVLVCLLEQNKFKPDR